VIRTKRDRRAIRLAWRSNLYKLAQCDASVAVCLNLRASACMGGWEMTCAQEILHCPAFYLSVYTKARHSNGWRCLARYTCTSIASFIRQQAGNTKLHEVNLNVYWRKKVTQLSEEVIYVCLTFLRHLSKLSQFRWNRDSNFAALLITVGCSIRQQVQDIQVQEGCYFNSRSDVTWKRVSVFVALRYVLVR